MPLRRLSSVIRLRLLLAAARFHLAPAAIPAAAAIQKEPATCFRATLLDSRDIVGGQYIHRRPQNPLDQPAGAALLREPPPNLAADGRDPRTGIQF